MTSIRYEDLKIGVPMQDTGPLTSRDYIAITNGIYRGEIKRYRKYFFFGPKMLKKVRITK